MLGLVGTSGNLGLGVPCDPALSYSVKELWNIMWVGGKF